jgi:large subunit ribosomal protein L10
MPSLAKGVLLKEVVETFRSHNYIFLARYRGLSAGDFVELRQKLGKVADRSLVSKNSIVRLAFKQAGVSDINGLIKGSIFVTAGRKEPQLISKALVDFAKGRENFELGGACMDGTVYQASYIKALAELPSRDALLASVVGGLNAPIAGFVHVLGGLMKGLAIVLGQIQAQKAR